jgi:hypothetical protein
MATDGPGKAPGHSARFYAAVSIAAALATVGLKAAAYLLTGSVGLLSDAAESSANLIATHCNHRSMWPTIVAFDLLFVTLVLRHNRT